MWFKLWADERERHIVHSHTSGVAQIEGFVAPATIQETLHSDFVPHLRDHFPNILTILLYLATLPVPTCTCERSISLLRRVKTYLRSTTSDPRLNDLAILQSTGAHQQFSEDEMIDAFLEIQPNRKVDLVYKKTK